MRKVAGPIVVTAAVLLFLAEGSVAQANLSGRWTGQFVGQRQSARVTWDLVDRGGRITGAGANRQYTITGTATAGGAVNLHFEGPNAFRDFTGTVDAAGRTMTGSWVGSRGGRGTLTVTRVGNPPTIGTTGPLAPPAPGVAVNIQDGPGTTYVRLPGKTEFATLRGGAHIRVGSELDTTEGTVTLTSADGKSTFTRGKFVVKQAKVPVATRVTDIVLTGGDFSKCPKTKKGVRLPSGAARPALLDQPIRQVWGSGKGKFKTTGKYAAATVRGTQWRVIDRCDGTLTKVLSGRVEVRDFKRKRTVVVTAGRSYLARK